MLIFLWAPWLAHGDRPRLHADDHLDAYLSECAGSGCMAVYRWPRTDHDLYSLQWPVMTCLSWRPCAATDCISKLWASNSGNSDDLWVTFKDIHGSPICCLFKYYLS